MAGHLDTSIEPQALFDVPLSDETAIDVERVRLDALLTSVERLATPAPSSSSAPPAASGAPPAPSASASVSASPEPPSPPGVAALDRSAWDARLALDRARFAFYRLDHDTRAGLLADQARRREAARPPETDEQRRAREAEVERQQALESAREARTEAQRTVGEELARLIGLESDVAAARARFVATRAGLTANGDVLLGWQRRVKTAMEGTPDQADATYDGLRKTLRASRDELAHALDELDASSSSVPALGPDPLASVPADIPTDEVRKRRESVKAQIEAAHADEESLRRDRAASLLDEVIALNRERLALLNSLSSDKRSAITGFTADGWDQASAEARHLVLVLRYHWHVVGEWFGSVRGGGSAGVSFWRIAALVVPWFAWLAFFVWWSRKAPGWLRLGEERLAKADRAERRVKPSPLRVALRFVEAVRRPVEWLLFYGVSVWLLPASAQDLLEVQLAASIIGWTLGGALIVDTINVLAGGTMTSLPGRQDAAGLLRLRSLRLVGRVIVAFVLVLVLSRRLVGEGTVYSWVLSTCWAAAIPVFLVLVRWWRVTVFERVERARKQTRVESWVLANRRGWKSFLAAMVGAVHLFGMGIWRTARVWVGRFDLTRRAHAYLFKRELERLAGERKQSPATPLQDEARASLSPDRPADSWVGCPAQTKMAKIYERAAAGEGAVVALVGARGSGKSSILRALAERELSSIVIDCRSISSCGDLERKLDDAGGTEKKHAALVLLDDAQALVKPAVGGLKLFDQVMALARSRSRGSVWIFSIDGSMWPLVARARDARPLFDEAIHLAPWSEEQIGALLLERSAHAGLAPSFEDLLEEAGPTTDEIDRQEALLARRAGYFRMLWDHVRGNPGMALEVWRSSLMKRDDGSIRVRALHVPEASVIDGLPDTALFVLRAILQLGPASIEDVAEATRLPSDQVIDAFRFGQTHGCLENRDEGIRISWRWLRPVERLLERRHLLVNS